MELLSKLASDLLVFVGIPIGVTLMGVVFYKLLGPFFTPAPSMRNEMARPVSETRAFGSWASIPYDPLEEDTYAAPATPPLNLTLTGEFSLSPVMNWTHVD